VKTNFSLTSRESKGLAFVMIEHFGLVVQARADACPRSVELKALWTLAPQKLLEKASTLPVDPG
jgi:hypothetical protein